MRAPLSAKSSRLAAALLLLAFAVPAPAGRAQQPDRAADPLSEALAAGSDGVPVLVRHLPDWEGAQSRATYTTDSATLRRAIPAQPVLEVVPLDGRSEAATADYGAAGRLAVVEYQTPQIAFDADAAIKQRIEELRAAGQAVPTVYRRVGNYSVFVFGGTDGVAAERLAGQVKYEKDVRWLGEDPHLYDKQNRHWIAMSASVLINTVKATGLAIILCLGVGGLFGTLIFRRRRAQAALAQSYSDAGGTMRLNLDDHAAEMLGQGEK